MEGCLLRTTVISPWTVALSSNVRIFTAGCEEVQLFVWREESSAERTERCIIVPAIKCDGISVINVPTFKTTNSQINVDLQNVI